MPSLGSGEILGAWKVPNGDLRPSPPPSLVRSSCSGVAWQEAQPPAKNMVRPLARFGVYAASVPAGTVAGTVTIQNAATPIATATRMTITRRRTMLSFHPGPMTSLSASYQGNDHGCKAWPETPRGGASRDAPPPPCGRGRPARPALTIGDQLFLRR